MEQRLTRLDRAQAWLRLRKNTVIAHWLFGILCGVVAVLFFPASLALLLIFAGVERWNDLDDIKNKITKLYSGCADWADSWQVYCGTLSIAVILDLVGLISIRWW